MQSQLHPVAFGDDPGRSTSFASLHGDHGTMIAAVLLGTGALVAVHLLLRGTYWDYSEGVYALTAHLILHGGDLYGRIVGAQPPAVFLVGAGLLAIHSSVEWLRFGVGCLQLAAGLIAARIVYRLSENRMATVLTPAAVLLTPWAVHEHGALIPEVVSLPVMLGAALLSVDRRRAVAAGVLCGLLALIKVPLVIPAVAIVAFSANPRTTAVTAAITLTAGLALTTILAGESFWRDVFLAQLQTGSRSLGALKGFWAAGGLEPARSAVLLRGRDPDAGGGTRPASDAHHHRTRSSKRDHVPDQLQERHRPQRHGPGRGLTGTADRVRDRVRVPRGQNRTHDSSGWPPRARSRSRSRWPRAPR